LEKFFLVGLCGVAGAMARYHLSRHLNKWTFPLGTMLVNIAGSFLLGLVVSIKSTAVLKLFLVLGLGTGFIGSFTTFSTMNYEVMTLLKNQKKPVAFTYAVSSLILGLLAVFAGTAAGRFL